MSANDRVHIGPHRAAFGNPLAFLGSWMVRQNKCHAC